MKNDPRSHGLWEKTAPEPPPTSPLAGEVTADVAIIGGGFTGMSAALHLAEAGRKAIVLEAEEIGYGASGRNVGLINAGMWVMPDEFPRVLGPVHGERLLSLLSDGPKLVFEMIEKHAIACEVEKNGTLHCAVDEKGLAELRQREAQWKKRGAPVRLLDARETASRLGTGGYKGAMLDMRAGTLQPLAYVRGLAHAAARAGATIHTGSRVEGIERSGDRWVVRTAGGQVTAEWVITATDAYSTGPLERLRTQQVRLSYFNFATKPLGDNLSRTILPGREGAWTTHTVMRSFRMDKTGRLIFGSIGALRGSGTSIHKGWIRRTLRREFPQLGDVEFDAEWFGTIGMTGNHLPRFHRLGPKMVGFSAYNGRGIAPGTVFGKILAGHVLGETAEDELPLPVTDPVDAQFRTIREGFYEAGAQAAHLTGSRF
ncbi:MAG: NAD(P)/FAD-dependent oxidoreductase [Parvibaculaceae bacterium]